VKDLEEMSKRLDSEIKRNFEQMSKNLDKLKDERRKEEIKDKENSEAMAAAGQKLQENNKKVDFLLFFNKKYL